MIEDAVWNLGQASDGSTVAQFYSSERGTSVYSGHATTWTGKVGLMYPSDYVYATSGSTSISRETCITGKTSGDNSNWYYWTGTVGDSRNGGPCAQNDYLFDSSHWQWTITPYSGNSDYVFYVNGDGYVHYHYAIYADNTYGTGGVRPAVFLKSSISISGGSGTASDPYTLTG